MVIKEVETDEQIALLSALADEIWHEYFGTIISEEQINYMVKKFQSIKAITSQIRCDSYKYFLFYVGDIPVGYTGIKPETDTGALFLSKLYVKKEYRSKGYASAAFKFMTDYCRNNNLSYIYLTVNRHNDPTINIYKKKGFYIEQEKCTDIGSGFFMDDYLMRLNIK